MVAAPLSMDAITNAVRATPEGKSMTMERIRMALHMMCAESVGFVSKQGDLGSQYVISIHKSIFDVCLYLSVKFHVVNLDKS